MSQPHSQHSGIMTYSIEQPHCFYENYSQGKNVLRLSRLWTASLYYEKQIISSGKSLKKEFAIFLSNIFHLIGEKSRGNPACLNKTPGFSHQLPRPPSSEQQLWASSDTNVHAWEPEGSGNDVGHLSAYIHFPGIRAGSWHTHHRPAFGPELNLTCPGKNSTKAALCPDAVPLAVTAHYATPRAHLIIL